METLRRTAAPAPPTEIPLNFAGCLMEVREPRSQLGAEAEEAA